MLTLYSYLFNPFTIASCLAQTSALFTNCTIASAIAAAISGNTINTIFALALSSYLSMYPVLLAPPLALLAFDQNVIKSKFPPTATRFYLGFTAGLAIAIGILLYASYIVTDFSWDFLYSTYGIQLTLSDLTPNIGLWWYFFIEMFDSFRHFFLGVFWLHMSSYVVGLSIRIR
jgi:phosphatidylinositol glycan class U